MNVLLTVKTKNTDSSEAEQDSFFTIKPLNKRPQKNEVVKIGKIFRTSLIPLSDAAKKRINSRFTFFFLKTHKLDDKEKRELPKVLIECDAYHIEHSKGITHYDTGTGYGLEAFIKEDDTIVLNTREAHMAERRVKGAEEKIWPVIRRIEEITKED